MLEVKSEDLQREQTAPAYEGMVNLSSDKIKRKEMFWTCIWKKQGTLDSGTGLPPEWVVPWAELFEGSFGQD